MLLICHSLPPVRWAALPTPALLRWREEIAVYRVPIAENQALVPQLQVLLTEAEQQRARRFHAAADYYRFVIGRAALRLLLGACLGELPTDVRLVSGPTQKPRVATDNGLHYNVSHAGNWVLIAVAPAEVGIDVEKITPNFPFHELLPGSFSPAERTFIAQHPLPAAAFCQLWTRKEALVKATAQGIDADFSQVPALDGRHEWPATHPSPVTEWLVSSFSPAVDYAAALAYPASVAASQVRFYAVTAVTQLITGC